MRRVPKICTIRAELGRLGLQMGLNTDTITHVGPEIAYNTPSAAHSHTPLSTSHPKTRIKMVQNEQRRYRKSPEETVFTNGRAVWYAHYRHTNLAGCTKPGGFVLLSLLWCTAIATADWIGRRGKGGKEKKRKEVASCRRSTMKEHAGVAVPSIDLSIYTISKKSKPLQSFATVFGFTATLCTEQAN